MAAKGILICVLSCAVLQAKAITDSCEKVALPDEAQAVLKAKFPAWRIVTLADLDQDERADWLSAHPGLCPGIALGQFDLAHGDSYAVSLFRPLGNYQYREALVILTKEAGKYSISILSPDSEVTAHVYVVWQQPSGTYEDVSTGRKIRIALPIITYEAIGAGATAYYWQGTSFKSFILSE